MSNDDSATFLQALYQDSTTGLIEIRYIGEGKRPLQRWFGVHSVPFDKLLAANQNGYNVYFGVGLRSGRGGDKTAVETVPALWLDLDAKDFDGNKDAAGGALAKLPGELVPSIILDSGHGYHAYWLLQQPAALNGVGETAGHVEALMRGLAGALGGDSSVADVARIMRLPGYWNVKDPAAPVLCEIVSLDAGRRFDLGQFAAYRLEEATTAASHSDRPVLPRRAKDFLAVGATTGDRNEAAFYAACQLRDAGYSKDEAMTMVLAGAARSTPPADPVETARTVESAYSRAARQPLQSRRPPQPAEPAKPEESDENQIHTEPKASFTTFWTTDKRPVLARWTTSRDGSTRYQVPIAWFIPTITGERTRHKASGDVIRDLDLEIRTWRLAVTATIEPDVIADTKRFYGACVRAVGADARLIDPGAVKYLPQAALELAPSDRPQRVVYEMTGWQEIGGRLCYLSPAGGVGVPENVQIDLSNLEAHIGLIQDGLCIGGVSDRGDDTYTAGLAGLELLLQAYPDSVILPALGFVFLAPLIRWSPIPDRPALHFVGTTGTRKTALLGLLQAFYGCPRFLLSWQSTGNSLEIAMSQTRDMLVTVDDLKQTVGDRGVGRRVIQSYADRRGRGRATAKGELAQARFAGGLLASAGEDIPEGEASVVARSLFVTISRGAANMDKVNAAQGMAGHFSTITARYIAWLLAGIDRLPGEVSARVAEHRDFYRDCLLSASGINDAGRVATSCGLLLTGMQYLTDFLQSRGDMGHEASNDVLLKTRLELLELASNQARIMVQESFAQSFLSAVKVLLETRQAYLVPVARDGQLDALDSVSAPTGYPTNAKVCGWDLGAEIWLRPDTIWAEVATWLSRQGRPMPSREGLYRQLDDMGAIARSSGNKTTYVAKIQDRATRVLALLKSALEEK